MVQYFLSQSVTVIEEEEEEVISSAHDVSVSSSVAEQV